VPGIYRSTRASGVDTLSRYDVTTLAFEESVTDVTSPVVVDGKLWGVGTGSRAGTLVRLNVDDVTDVLDTVSVPGLTEWSASYLPYTFFSASTSQVFNNQQPDPDEIDIRVRCRKADWSEARTSTLLSRKLGGGFSLSTINPYQVLLVSGEFRFGIRTGATGYQATETAANLGCVNGEWRWLRFTYNNTSYDNDNPTAEWRRRFWSSDDGTTWTQVSYSTLAGGGALDTGAASTELRVGNETENGSGWDGDISHVVAYDENDDLIHDLALVDLGSPLTGSNSWTASTTGETWTAGSGINPAGTGYGYTLSGDGTSLFLASRNSPWDNQTRDRLRDVEILQKRDATTGALEWQVDGYDCNWQPSSAVDDGTYTYVVAGETVSSANRQVTRLDTTDGTQVDDLTWTGSDSKNRLIRIGDITFIPDNGIRKFDFTAATTTLIVTAANTNDIESDGEFLYQVESGFGTAEINKYEDDGTVLQTLSVNVAFAELIRYDTRIYTTGRATSAGLLAVDTDITTTPTTAFLSNTDPLTGLAVLYENPPAPPGALSGIFVGAVVF